MTFKIGDKAKWNSSNVEILGEIVAVVPSGKLPIDLGFKRLDNSGLPRDHETYIVEARRLKRGSSDGRDMPFGFKGA